MILHRTEKEIVSIILDNIPDTQNVQAVLLYGSRADGRAVEGSDYDVIIIKDGVTGEHVCFNCDGISYSCYLYPPEIVQKDNMNSRTAFFCFRAKPLYDPEGIGKEFARIADQHVELESKATKTRCQEIEYFFSRLQRLFRKKMSKLNVSE